MTLERLLPETLVGLIGATGFESNNHGLLKLILTVHDSLVDRFVCLSHIPKMIILGVALPLRKAVLFLKCSTYLRAKMKRIIKANSETFKTLVT